MVKSYFPHLLFMVLVAAVIPSCNPDLEHEEDEILAVINAETAAAFNRDYEAWRDKWVHETYVVKTYMDFRDTTITETLGFQEIDDFVRTYIQEHPEPAPLPQQVDSIEVQLFGDGAWVSYRSVDPGVGPKRETRLMKKVNGAWKIAGMHTTIYAPE